VSGRLGGQATTLNTANGQIAFRFHARDLHLVMGPAASGTSVRFRALLDRYERAAKGSVADGFEPRIRELLRAVPDMPSTVIAERIGWPFSIRTLSGRVAELRPAYLPADPASRTAYAAAELAQCDFWFPDTQVPVGFGQVRTAKQLPVLTVVSGYSRWASALLVPSRCAEDLFAGWWAGIEALGAVPKLLVWDGEGAIGRRRGGRIELTAECQGFRGTLATSVYVCQPRDPEAKGLVERFHDYLERSWLPGRVFASPADFNAQLAGWIATVNTRWRRHLECSRRTGSAPIRRR
jgi:transposase